MFQKKIIATFIFIGLTAFVYAQTPKEKTLFSLEEFFHKIEYLKEEFCENKTIPDEYELACIIVLSHYPELKDKNIKFVYSKGSYSMAARPAPLSLFRKRDKREYRVFINTKSRNQGLLLSEVPFNAQLGILGHELAHILYYTRNSSLKIILDGIAYSSKKFRARYEKAADKEAIDRGFGWQLYEFSNKTLITDKVPQAYKLYKERIYMTPQSILDYIENQHAD